MKERIDSSRQSMTCAMIKRMMRTTRLSRLRRVAARGAILGIALVLATPLSEAHAESAPIAPPIVSISGREDRVPLARKLELFSDPSRSLNLADIRKLPPQRWAATDEHTPNPGYTRAIVWGRFQIENTAAEPVSVLLEQSSTILDDVQLFATNEKDRRDAGTLLFRTGDAHPYQQRPIPSRTFVFPIHLAPGAAHTYYMRLDSTTAVSFPLTLWGPDAFRRHELNVYLLFAGYFGLMGGMIVYNLILFLSVRDSVYWMYAAFLASNVLTQAFYYGIMAVVLGSLTYLNNPAFTTASIVASVILGVLLMDRLIQVPPGWPRRTVRLIPVSGILFLPLGLLADGAAHLFAWLGLTDVSFNQARFSNWLQIPVQLQGGFALVAIAFTIAYGTWRCLKRERSAYFFMGGWSLMLLGGLVSLPAALGMGESPLFGWITPLAGIAMMALILSLGLADRINQTRTALARLNDSLEEKVEERTEEIQGALTELAATNDHLNEALSEVRSLKEQQDGDYYLTSLLLEPLAANNNSSAHVATESHIDSYKRFQFRGRSRSVGGDLCLTEQIMIGERSFVVFVNADAMGKSMQGAGGALVLGSSLRARLIATLLPAASRSEVELPELWLRAVYADLQALFETFDGRMFASAILGLVDEKTGVIYYINADHPAPVFFRGGRVWFPRRESVVGQLGTEGQLPKLSINVVGLKEGDTMLMTSDGRDDIVHRTMAGGRMQGDRELFMAAVAEGRGRPREVHEALMKNHEAKDDLSYLSVSFVRHGARSPLDVRSLKVRGIHQVRSKQVQAALRTFRAYHAAQPADGKGLAQLSVLEAHLGNLERAIAYGEALLLRDRSNRDNLVHLERIHSAVGNVDRAAEIRILQENLADSLKEQEAS